MRIDSSLWARIRWANVGRIVAVLAVSVAVVGALTRGSASPPVPSGELLVPAATVHARSVRQVPRAETRRDRGRRAAPVPPAYGRTRRRHRSVHRRVRAVPPIARPLPGVTAATGAGPSEFVP